MLNWCLIDACRAPCELLLPKNMDHIEFDFDGHFTQPLTHFLNRCGIKVGTWANGGRIIFPRKLFETPEYLKTQNKQSSTQSNAQDEEKKKMIKLFSTLADNKNATRLKAAC